jgi:PPE-repeat protein
MADAAAPYMTWVTTTATQAEQAANQARAAVTAYETAFAATVPPALVAANRTQLATLIANNVFGQNTTQIADTEAAYAEMWAQDVHAMCGYAATSSAATTMTPFSEPPQTTKPAGQSGQTAAVTQATGGSAAAQSRASLSRLMSAVPQQLHTLATAGSSGSSASTSSPSMLTAVSDFNTLTSPVNLASGLSRTYTSAGSFASGLFRANVQGSGHLPAAATQAVTVGAKELPSEGVGGPVLGGLGRAAPIGGLSVPQSWASATPVASAAEEPQWLSEMDLEAATTATATSTTSTIGGAPIAGLGPSAGNMARPTVNNILRVGPRRFTMPRPPVGG